MKTTIGGDRLGSGNKQEVSAKNYNRSSHDLSEIWRSTMASGTLVPFLNKVALPGDSWDIDLNCEVLTLPTIGPLFGSFKVQLDVFQIPIRLYNARLHMNMLGVGMDMSKVLLPQYKLGAIQPYGNEIENNAHVNSSCLAKYLGVSGLGRQIPHDNQTTLTRNFNAVPLLAYWDIYKNYYSNKQEEVGYQIATNDSNLYSSQIPLNCINYDANDNYIGNCFDLEINYINNIVAKTVVQFPADAKEPELSEVKVTLANSNIAISPNIYPNAVWDDKAKTYTFTGGATDKTGTWEMLPNPALPESGLPEGIRLQQFNLENIDNMRKWILQADQDEEFVIGNLDGIATPYPYLAMSDIVTVGSNGDLSDYKAGITFSQQGLGLKTYQSDLFNNWINTEWIDGTGGVNDISAVSTSGGSFTIDSLNIAQKIYNMMNRIAVSGGTYDDWLDAVYTHERSKSVESPVYMGSLIKELAFQEVVSNSASDVGGQQPLGELAGRGKLTPKDKGGKIKIKVDEPSYIMGIVSITPRLDYSQGNDWDVNLKTMNDFHKPALDGIGFQELITEQMAWQETTVGQVDGSLTFQSAGKQPAWINYMTSVNKVYGHFAEENNSMFMTLNRRYDIGTSGIEDLTTYVDPSKFNHIFAQTDLTAQNFWVQISKDITARRKMSAKVIPNL